MNRLQLIDTFRRRVRDTAKPYLWSSDDVQEFLDDAHWEAAERSYLLRDSTTAEICEVPVLAATAAYELDPRILFVTRARLDSQQRPLHLTSVEQMDATPSFFDWQRQTGTPERLVLTQEGKIWRATINPIPAVADVLRLHVVRGPLCSLAEDKSEPELPLRLHVKLVDWMEYRAYSVKDSQTQDDQKAADAADAFTVAFGPPQSANTRRTQHDRAPTTIEFREF